MSPKAPKRGFTRADWYALLGPDAGASAYGGIEWAGINGAWRGRIEVGHENYDPGDLRLEIMHRPRLCTEPTLVYRVFGGDLARVDINGRHHGRRFTHLQYYKASGEPLITEDVSAKVIDVPLGPSVEDDLLTRAWRDAARVLHLDTSGVDWTNPPEGSPG